jgi:hypothetical protein
MPTIRAAAGLAAALLLTLTAQAQAGIWTSTPSGTTGDIAAIDYAAADRLLVATSNGQILRNGELRLTSAGTSFRDIALNPARTIGLATANNGKLFRSADGGATWTQVALPNVTFNHTCGGGGPFVRNATVTGNLVAVSWASDTVAYVAAGDRGVVLKTTNGGATWTDVSRQADGTCFADPGSGASVTDVFALPGSDNVTLVTDNFGARRFSANGLTSSATAFNSSAVNCFDVPTRLAVDRVNPNRIFVVAACSGSLSFGASEDGGSTFDLSFTYQPSGAGSGLTGMYDVDYAGSSALAVGNGGRIFVAPDTMNAYSQPADGPDATADWRAADKLDGDRAAVGGRNGRLVLTTQASAIPDLVAPAGTISGPTRVAAGTPATFTANLADNAGGSGIDPASISWSATGIPGATGNPVSLTFPSAGTYRLRVGFRDLAGNPGEAELSVTVTGAAAPPSADPAVVGFPGPTYLGDLRPTTTTVPGASITFSTPQTCVRPGQRFSVRLTFKRQRRKGNKFVKVRRADFFIGTRRVKIDRKAPFSQVLTVTAGARPGSTLTVRARAYIKVRRGKSPTKSIRSTIRVCGG